MVDDAAGVVDGEASIIPLQRATVDAQTPASSAPALHRPLRFVEPNNLFIY
jgi:hypothetical protein